MCINQNLLPVSLTNNFGVKPSTVFYEEWTGRKSGQTGKILAQYPSTAALKAVGLEGRGFRKIIHVALELVVDEIEDYFTPEFQDEEKLLSLHEALEQVHHPDDKKNLQNAISRLKYDEHFFLQLLMALKRKAKEENLGRIFSKPVSYTHLTLPTILLV